MKKRLFVGIKIKPTEKLLELYSNLKQKLENENIIWTKIENLHITLKFLGDTDTKQIPSINKSLMLVTNQFKNFQIQIKGIGQFKKKSKTNVIWLGLSNFEKLNALAEIINNEMNSLGFESEDRSYKAHLTIGRVKYLTDETGLTKIIEKFENKVIQYSDIEVITLYVSILSSGGTSYLPLFSVELLK